MKKLLLHGVVFLMTLNAYGQLTVVESDPCYDIGTFNIGHISVKSCGDQVMFLYRDSRYTYITEYEGFYIKYSDIQEFYDLIKEGLKNPPEKEIFIKLSENESLNIRFSKSIINYNVSFVHFVNDNIIGTSAYMSKGTINNMFNAILVK